MAKRVQRDRLAQRRGFGGLLEQPAELTRGQFFTPVTSSTYLDFCIFTYVSTYAAKANRSLLSPLARPTRARLDRRQPVVG